jgi:hypothetical protein
MKKKSQIAYIPSPQYPLLVGDPADILLDPDFDDIDELILFEPPILATRMCGGHLTRMDDGEDDE